MYKTILVQKKNDVGIVTLNRPEKLNAMNLQLKKELHQALDEMEADDDVQVVIMTGSLIRQKRRNFSTSSRKRGC